MKSKLWLGVCVFALLGLFATGAAGLGAERVDPRNREGSVGRYRAGRAGDGDAGWNRYFALRDFG